MGIGPGNRHIRLCIAVAAALGAASGWAGSLPADPAAPYRANEPGVAPVEATPRAVPFAATAAEVLIIADPKRHGIFIEASATAPDADRNIERRYRALLGSARNATLAVVENGRVFLRGTESAAIARAGEITPPEPAIESSAQSAANALGKLADSGPPRHALESTLPEQVSAQSNAWVAPQSAGHGPGSATLRQTAPRPRQAASLDFAVEARGRVELGSRAEAGEWLVLRAVSMATVRDSLRSPHNLKPVHDLAI